MIMRMGLEIRISPKNSTVILAYALIAMATVHVGYTMQQILQYP
jgi:hypothetical protein